MKTFPTLVKVENESVLELPKYALPKGGMFVWVMVLIKVKDKISSIVSYLMVYTVSYSVNFNKN